MKKTIFSVLMLFLLSFVANAQIKTTRQCIPIDMDIKVKRCVVSGSQGYIDLVFTNHTGKLISDVIVMRQEPCADVLENDQTIMYDDEGGVYKPTYKGGISWISFGGSDALNNRTTLPEDVPVKMRIEFQGISEFATEISMLNIALRGISSYNYGIGSVTFRNIPITLVETE